MALQSCLTRCDRISALGRTIAVPPIDPQARAGVFPTSYTFSQIAGKPRRNLEKDTPMMINPESLSLAFAGFKTVFTDAYMAAQAEKSLCAFPVPAPMKPMVGLARSPICVNGLARAL